MKNLILISILFLFCLHGYAQTLYQLEKNILYRDAATESLDDYMQERCKLDLYYPKNTKGFPTLIWIHGGGLKGGNKHIPDPLLEQEIAVVTINYRLAPKAEAPAFIDDAAAAVAWVFQHIAEYGGDPEKIFVTGHSAGGYLVSMIGLDKSYLQKYEVDADKVKAYLPLSGQTVTHLTIREAKGFGETQPIIDEYAPVYHVRADAPPFIMITGDSELEIPARYEENLYLQKIMELAGHKNTILYELEGFNHGTMVNPACDLVLRHLRRILEKKE